MEDRQYRIMAEVEAEHWWYRGLRDMIRRALHRRGYTSRRGLRVLDAGCGTGANLAMLHGLLHTDYLGGFDPSPLALDYARSKIPSADLYAGDLCNPSFHQDRYDLVISCDVLSMTGFEAAREGVRRIVERLEPGGLMLVNLPAYRWLYSRHDVVVGTRHRFTAHQVRQFLESAGLEIDLLTYRLFSLFPAVVLARLPSILCRPRARQSQSDLVRPGTQALRGLAALLACENRLILRGVRFPWGSSVFAAAVRGAGQVAPRP
ncbi:MAG: class I SAM-dependent DNA methyltransferase [Thermoguttaceae bacterium]